MLPEVDLDLTYIPLMFEGDPDQDLDRGFFKVWCFFDVLVYTVISKFQVYPWHNT